MAGSLNKVLLIGNLGKDPEIRTMQNGGRVANLSVATSQSWTDKQSGERKEKTEWHRVVIFNEKLVEVAEKYLTKGRKVYIEGALQTRKWQDQGGNDRYSTEIVLQAFGSTLTILDSKREEPDGDHGTAGRGDQGEKSAPAGGRTALPRGAEPRPPRSASELDDDIPF